MTEEKGFPPAPARPPDGRNRFAIATWIFLRLLGLVHLVAFVSTWIQIEGLIGPRGLLPATRYFEAVRAQLGGSAWRQLPSFCWVFGTETFLHVLCGAGVLCSAFLFAGVAPAPCLFVLWLGYLSLSCAGQVFFNFQWDTLLLETTLLAVFLAPWSLLPRWRLEEPPRLARLLLWWLAFRLLFLAGVVKLASGDERWRDLSALTFHYETQPLPTVLGWYAHQLPAWWQRASCAGMFTLELLVPFFLFGPRVLRHHAVLLLAGFMALIALTGNYTFFNLLAIALCLLGLDDQFWCQLLPRRSRLSCNAIRYMIAPLPRWRRWITGPFAAFAFAYTAVETIPVVFRGVSPPPGFNVLAGVVGPFRSFNTYGLFAVMTNPRLELVFEGSDDGREWRAYEFRHKPGEPSRRPTWVAPHQPRLDWQLWFAALGAQVQNPWVLSLCEHLLQGTPEVLGLLAANPFPEKPPRAIRVVRYEYHFTDPAARQRTAQWWRRTPIDLYLPSVSLR